MFYICILSTNGNAIKCYSPVIGKHEHILPLVMFIYSIISMLQVTLFCCALADFHCHYHP